MRIEPRRMAVVSLISPMWNFGQTIKKTGIAQRQYPLYLLVSHRGATLQSPFRILLFVWVWSSVFRTETIQPKAALRLNYELQITNGGSLFFALKVQHSLAQGNALGLPCPLIYAPCKGNILWTQWFNYGLTIPVSPLPKRWYFNC